MIEDVDYTASGYIQAIAPDGTVISRHRQEREAQQACFQHAKDNEDLLGDGVHDYILRSPDVRMSIRLLSVGGNPTNEDTTPPDPPAGVFNNGVTSTGFTTNWTNGPESDLQEHNVYRSSTGPSSGFSLVDTVTVPTASYSHTGLAAETQYWVYVTALDSSGNESVASSVVNSTTGAVTSDTNAQRISTILAGRSPHFAYNTPADPVTTGDVTVTNATDFNFYASAATGGSTIIRVNSSFSGNITITASDVDIVMSNSATITGALTLGSAGNRASRIRWTGGNHVGSFTGLNYQDVLFDDWYSNLTSSADWHQVVEDQAVQRLAIINSTLEYSGGGSGATYHFYIGPVANVTPLPSTFHEDIFFGNAKLISNGQHTARIMGVQGLMFVDSVLNPDGAASGAGLRLHYSDTDVWIKDTWIRDNWNANGVNDSDPGPAFTNAVFDNVDRYTSEGQYIFSAGGGAIFDANSNVGTVQNSTLYNPSGTGVVGWSATGYTNGGGNSNSTWDGSTVPDYSAIGAVR